LIGGTSPDDPVRRAETSAELERARRIAGGADPDRPGVIITTGPGQYFDLDQAQAQQVEDAVRSGGRAVVDGDTLMVVESQAARQQREAAERLQQRFSVPSIDLADPSVRLTVEELIAEGVIRTPQDLFDLAEGRQIQRTAQIDPFTGRPIGVSAIAPRTPSDFFFDSGAVRDRPPTGSFFGEVGIGLQTVAGGAERLLSFFAPPQLADTPDQTFFGRRAAQQRTELQRALGIIPDQTLREQVREFDVQQLLRGVPEAIGSLGPALRTADLRPTVRGTTAFVAESAALTALLAPRQTARLARGTVRFVGRDPFISTIFGRGLVDDTRQLTRQLDDLLFKPPRAALQRRLDPAAARGLTPGERLTFTTVAVDPATGRAVVTGDLPPGVRFDRVAPRRPVVPRSAVEAGLDPIELAQLERVAREQQLLLGIPPAQQRAFVTESGAVAGFDPATGFRLTSRTFDDPLNQVLVGDALTLSEAIRRRTDLERLLRAGQDPRQTGLFPVQVISTQPARPTVVLEGTVGGGLIPRATVDDLLGPVIKQPSARAELRLQLDEAFFGTRGFQRSLSDFVEPSPVRLESFQRSLLARPFSETITDPRAAENIRLLLSERRALERLALDPRRTLPAPRPDQIAIPLPDRRRLGVFGNLLSDRRGTVAITRSVPRSTPRSRLRTTRTRFSADDDLLFSPPKARSRIRLPFPTRRVGVSALTSARPTVISDAVTDLFFNTESLSEVGTESLLEPSTDSILSADTLLDIEPAFKQDTKPRQRTTTELLSTTISLTDQEALQTTLTAPRARTRARAGTTRTRAKRQLVPGLPQVRGMGGVTGPEYEVTVGRPGNKVYVPPVRGGREAVKAARDKARTTAAATVKVVKLTPDAPPVSDLFGRDFKRGRTPNTYVERRNQRMNTPTEVAEITGAQGSRGRFNLTNPSVHNFAMNQVNGGKPLRTVRNQLKAQTKLGGGLLDDFF
jgi:hypothetical protein